MARRLHMTLADYMVVAISPALIMALIGSVVYLLLQLCYGGHAPDRLHWCLSMFVFGSVLVGRISIEEGWERAAPYGIGLAFVVFLATQKFVDYEGTLAAGFGAVVNLALLGLTWWLANKLTWDCTVIDDNQDASGEGLLEKIGLDAAKVDVAAGTAQGVTGAVAPAEEELEGTTERAEDQQSARGAKGKQKKPSAKRQPHAPGVWALRFSLAALPLFALGQVFIPLANGESRRYVFELFCVFLASGLGLLLTTSFLGLRRYLRQRRLQMPTTMAGAWLGGGVAIILAVLFFCALLPRTNAEIKLSQVPSLKPAETRSSRYSVGRSGAKERSSEKDRSVTEDSRQKAEGSRQTGKEEGKEGGQKGGEQGKGAGDNKGSADSKQQSEQSSQGQAPAERQKQAQDKSQDQSSANGPTPASDQPPSKGPASSDAKQPMDSSQGEPKTAEQQSPPDKSPGEQGEKKSAEQPEEAAQPPEAPAPSPIDSAGDWLSMFQRVFYLLLFVGGAYAAWRWREQVIDFLRRLAAAWGEIWASLFGGRAAVAVPALPASLPPLPRSFSEFFDPFASGDATRWAPRELVRYTFDAFEVWAREHGTVRDPSETPHELARQVGQRHAALAGDSRFLADLYAQVAYAPGAPVAGVERLRSLWSALRPVERSARER